MRSKRKRRKRAVKGLLPLLVLMVGGLAIVVGMRVKSEPLPEEINTPVIVQTAAYNSGSSLPVVNTFDEPTEAAEVTGVAYESYRDPDNYRSPFNNMSADWGAEVYESGFRYYKIPKESALTGGCLPEVVQVYTWCLCKKLDLDYYMVLAMIERESGYRYDAEGDKGNSIGYLQIYEKWHKERMAEESVISLYDPYGNIRVGLNLIKELEDKYKGSSGEHCVLMAYSMGESRAKEFWAEGIYSSEYSRAVIARAEEIKQELSQE